MTALEAQPAIQTINPARAQLAIAPLVLAFATDPAVRWMYPDAHQYRTFFPQFVRAFAGQAFALGTAQVIGEFHGTALWLPPGVQPDDEVIGPLLEETVTTDRQEDLFALFTQMGANHPAEPHWYLPLVGVDPRHQRCGLGGALLATMLMECDREGLPAYLEATNVENVSLYERHGFEVGAEMQAGSSPRLFAMLRQPR